MYTPQGGGGRRSPLEPTRTRGADALEVSVCCVAGFLATSVVALLFYPVLVAVTRPLHLLSSTAIVVVLMLVWALVWLGIEVLWEWRAGRVSTAR